MKIEFKPMHMYLLDRSDDLDHGGGRPVIYLQFFKYESLVWMGTTKVDIKATDNPVNILLNNQITYFYNKGLTKIKTKAIKNFWANNLTRKVFVLSQQQQESLIAKFSELTLVPNPYQKINDLNLIIEQNKIIIKKTANFLKLFDKQSEKLK